jgi:hypothetical protein
MLCITPSIHAQSLPLLLLRELTPPHLSNEKR